jgi:hypothetical protein
VQLAADRVPILDVVADVQHRLPAGRGLDHREVGLELAAEVGGLRPLAAVLRQLEVDGGRQGIRIGRHDLEEMVRLFGAWRAQREEVVGASAQTGGGRRRPVLREALVDGVSAA